jgi:hypothetical protein
LSFLFATFFGFRISRALVNPEKWAAQSCQTVKLLNLVFNPPRKRNYWVTAQLVKTFLNSQKIARDASLKLLSNRREKKGERKSLKTEIIFKNELVGFCQFAYNDLAKKRGDFEVLFCPPVTN